MFPAMVGTSRVSNLSNAAVRFELIEVCLLTDWLTVVSLITRYGQCVWSVYQCVVSATRYGQCVCMSSVCGTLRPSSRQHLSCGDCLEGKRGDYLTSSVLLCIIIVHIICTPIQ